MLEGLLGPEGKRRLRLRHMTNDALFQTYDSDLVLRLHNAKDLTDHRKMLARFKEHLNGFPPSPELAKGFLAQYANRKPRTLARYSKMINGLMKFYGEPIDIKIKIPKTLPTYTEDGDIDKLFKAIETKKTHKKLIVRDALMTAVDLKTGLRRAELADLEVTDVHSDFLVVRNGKGGKDRVIPLVPEIALR
ncbi:MAG: tyrosine-type recombinase/integrase, partial [Chloroflexota bacterium]